MQDITSKIPSQDKDSKYFSQYKRLREFLKEKTTSRNMAAVYNDIPLQNVCRYVGMLRKVDGIAVVKKDRCAITKRAVEFLTTNPALFPQSNQLNLFDHED